MKKFAFAILSIFLTTQLFAAEVSGPDVKKSTLQSSEKSEAKPVEKSLSFFDPTDGYLDLSEFVLNAHGFIPVPIIITEPAVGSFGLGFVPVFIQRNPPVVRDGKTYPTQPTMTAIMAAYTANDTWAIGGGRIGEINDWGIKYKVGAGYADANLDFYKYFPNIDKTAKFGMNMRVIPAYLYIGKRLSDPRFTIALDYMFSDVDVKPRIDNPNIPDDWIRDFDSVQSKIGIIAEYDTRDNTFTPNDGIKAYVNAKFSSDLIGSDQNFQQMEEALYWYIPLTDRWINGLRIDFQQLYGNAPFYMKPYIDMRGIAALRYQGNYTGLIELEERFDFGETKRWSLVAFGGVGKGFDEFDEFSKTPWAYSYGVGGRYLLSRLLNLRAGVDVAVGSDGEFGWYIVFGSSWYRQ